MKNHIFATYIFIFLTIYSYAQEEASFPCVNNVSTDYREDINGNPKANNDKLPLVGVSPDNRFLNGFNWVDGNIGFGSYSTNGMMFTQNQSYGNMLNLKPQTQPAIEFYNYLWTGPEFTPEEGWELLLVNLGRYPDDITIQQYEENKFIPYVVLYNKYKGIIRVFLAYGRNSVPDGAIDGVEIDLEFSYPTIAANQILSGILRLGSGMDKSLEEKTTTTRLTAVAKNPGTEDKWYSADF